MIDLGGAADVVFTQGPLANRVAQVDERARTFGADVLVSISDEAVLHSHLPIPKVERASILRAYRQKSLLQYDLPHHGVVALVAQTPRLAALLRQSPRALPPIHVIEPWVEQLGDPRQVPGSPFTVTAVGRDVRVKNLEAIAELARRTPNLRFEICTPIARAPKQSHPSNLSLRETPSRGAVLEALRDADAYITLTQREGLSNATLDALALGLPLILTDGDEWAYFHGGAAMVWESWASSPTAEAYDITLRQIGDELTTLATSPSLYASMSDAAIRTAATFTYQRYRSRWSRVLKGAIT